MKLGMDISKSHANMTKVCNNECGGQKINWEKIELPDEKSILLYSLGFVNQCDLTTPNRARKKEICK